MKRIVILVILTICLISTFGALLHSPPSFVDVITGATPKAKRASENTIPAVTPSAYTLVINTQTKSLSDENVRRTIREVLLGENPSNSTIDISLRLAITQNNTFIFMQAKEIATQLESIGIKVDIVAYSETMLYSRAVYGKYELLLISDTQPSLPDLSGAEMISVLNGKEGE